MLYTQNASMSVHLNEYYTEQVLLRVVATIEGSRGIPRNSKFCLAFIIFKYLYDKLG